MSQQAAPATHIPSIGALRAAMDQRFFTETGLPSASSNYYREGFATKRVSPQQIHEAEELLLAEGYNPAASDAAQQLESVRANLQTRYRQLYKQAIIEATMDFIVSDSNPLKPWQRVGTADSSKVEIIGGNMIVPQKSNRDIMAKTITQCAFTDHMIGQIRLLARMVGVSGQLDINHFTQQVVKAGDKAFTLRDVNEIRLPRHALAALNTEVQRVP